MRLWRLGPAAAVCGAVIVSLGILPASAQVPLPASPEAAEIAACLCLSQAVNALGAAMAESRRAYDSGRDEVATMDAQLQGSRAGLDVNDPVAVAQFRGLLDRRDAASRRGTGAVYRNYETAVERYNARVGEYNARCANRPQSPILLNQVQATLTCPPPY